MLLFHECQAAAQGAKKVLKIFEMNFLIVFTILMGITLSHADANSFLLKSLKKSNEELTPVISRHFESDNMTTTPQQQNVTQPIDARC